MNTQAHLHSRPKSWTFVCWMAIACLVGGLSSCTSKPKSEVVVSVKDQKMGLYERGVLKKEFAISTSKFGIGDQPNSYRTPLGKHEVIAKIGHGLPTGAVLKSRQWNGEVLKPNAPGRDPIVSRILWLRGMESSNRNAMRRFIYIHGTTEESRLGKPASYGCIRMGMKDVVEVFNEVNIGAKVVVTRGKLPSGGKPEQPTPEAEIVVAGKAGEAQPVTTAIPVGPANATAPADNVQPKIEKEAPVAKSKTKKPSTKTEKITTSNRRNLVMQHSVHG